MTPARWGLALALPRDDPWLGVHDDERLRMRVLETGMYARAALPVVLDPLPYVGAAGNMAIALVRASPPSL